MTEIVTIDPLELETTLKKDNGSVSDQVESDMALDSLSVGEPVSSSPEHALADSGSLSWRHGERQRHHLSGEDLVVSVDQLDLHLVLAGR